MGTKCTIHQTTAIFSAVGSKFSTSTSSSSGDQRDGVLLTESGQQYHHPRAHDGAVILVCVSFLN